MKSLYTGFIFLLASLPVFSQLNIEKVADSIVTEGKRLYRLEMASWHGTDVFLEKFSAQRANVGGYFSYPVGAQTTCIFINREESPKVIATITFDSSFNTGTAKVEDVIRDFTPRERELFTLRKISKDLIYKDSLFKTYQNTSLNIIPVIENGEKKVYVLTGTQSDDVVLIGNDYLILFDQKNNIVSRKGLHNNMLQINYKPKNGDKVESAFHSHLPSTGEFITATDICTLMLYQHMTRFKQHYVMSDNYVSIWDCQKNSLTVLTREAWDNINKN